MFMSVDSALTIMLTDSTFDLKNMVTLYFKVQFSLFKKTVTMTFASLTPNLLLINS